MKYRRFYVYKRTHTHIYRQNHGLHRIFAHCIFVSLVILLFGGAVSKIENDDDACICTVYDMCYIYQIATPYSFTKTYYSPREEIETKKYEKAGRNFI